MKELTDEQYETMYFDIMKRTKGNPFPQKNLRIDAARAAYAASFPYAVEEALACPTEEENALLLFLWESARGYFTERSVARTSVMDFCSRRLRALTAKPDPAVEAVKPFAPQVYLGREEEKALIHGWAEEVVATVRSADGAQ